MTVQYSNTTYSRSPILGRTPRQQAPRPPVHLSQLHNRLVVIDEMHGRIHCDGRRVSFVPNAAAVRTPAYIALSQQVGDEWDEWDITEDIAALGQAAQSAGIGHMTITIESPHLAAMAAEMEQVMLRYSY